MSDSSGDEGALQIDMSGGADSIRGRGAKSGAGKSRKGWEPGDVVWAKVTGFNYWPAKVLFKSSSTVKVHMPCTSSGV